MIWQTFYYMDKQIFMLLYRSMVRSPPEAFNSAWVPHKKQDIETMDQVQERATKFIPGFKSLPYEWRLRLLELPTLTCRRVGRDMIKTYKTLAGVYNAEVVPNSPKGNKNTRGHKKKLFKRRATNLNCCKYFFTVTITTIWNDLPNNIANSPNIGSFKRCLDEDRRDHPSKYNYLENPYNHLS